MRLDKYIGQATDLSRKTIKKLVRDGLVHVDGEAALDPAMQVAADQHIEVADQSLAQPGPRYFMLNKPPGYICATTDGQHPIVLDLLDEPNRDKLQIAGRLDIDATGLVLITDDGRWNHAVTSPRRQCRKRYYVTTAEAIPPEAVTRFARGLMLQGEKHRTGPAELEIIHTNEARLAISEGRYHQVKRMFAALGNRVEELHREAVGDIVLDAQLDEGDYRPLTETEIASVYGIGEPR